MKTSKLSPCLRVLFAVAAMALLAVSMAGCKKDDNANNLAVGFIYVGPKDDYGYNQAHAQGAAAVKKMAGVKVFEEENIPERVDVQQSMKSMIEISGVKLVFPTSFGYFEPHVLE